MDKQAIEILLKLHEMGGCDASDDYSKGYDDAITAAIEAIEKITGVKLRDILE